MSITRLAVVFVEWQKLVGDDDHLFYRLVAAIAHPETDDAVRHYLDDIAAVAGHRRNCVCTPRDRLVIFVPDGQIVCVDAELIGASGW